MLRGTSVAPPGSGGDERVTSLTVELAKELDNIEDKDLRAALKDLAAGDKSSFAIVYTDQASGVETDAVAGLRPASNR
jgi:hypothetical protein